MAKENRQENNLIFIFKFFSTTGIVRVNFVFYFIATLALIVASGESVTACGVGAGQGMDKFADVEAEAGEITSSQEHRLLHSSFIVVAQDRPSTSTPNVADTPRNDSPAPSIPHRRAVLKYPASSSSEGRWTGKKKVRVLPKRTRGVRISCTDSHDEEHRGGYGDLGFSEGREPRRGGEGEDPPPSDPQPSLATGEVREPEAAAREHLADPQPSPATGEIREQGAVSREQSAEPQPSLTADEIREPGAASTEHLENPQPSLAKIIESEPASREQLADPQRSLIADEISEPGAASREHLAVPQPSLTAPGIKEPQAASRDQPMDPQRSQTADEIREPGAASREHLAVPQTSLTTPEIIEPEAASTEQPADPQPSLTADGTREPAVASIEHPADPEAMPTTDATSKDPSLAAERNEGARCSTEFPDEDDIPPLNLLDALKILTPDPRRVFAETDVLEYLRSLGISVPPPKGSGSVSGQ